MSCIGRRDEPVLPTLALPGAPRTLLRQVQARMRTLFPGCAVELRQVPQTNAVTLGLRTSDETGFHRPMHTGFGLTQILPDCRGRIVGRRKEFPRADREPGGAPAPGRARHR